MELDTTEIVNALKNLESFPEKELKVALMAFGEDQRGHILEQMHKQETPSGVSYTALNPISLASRRSGSRKRLLDSGLLANSIVVNPVNDLSVTIQAGGRKIKYANLQQHGGDIVPKKAKNLAIPLSKFSRNRKPRSFGDSLFFYKSKKTGNKFLARIKYKKMTLEYLLKEKVTIPATPFMGFSKDSGKRLAALILSSFKNINK